MTLQVDTFSFGTDDLPEELKIGYKLKNTVLRLSDGSRFLQEFGAETDDISFKGTFMYGDAVSRAQALETIFLARLPVQFVCDYVTQQVTITEYNYTIYWQSRVDYAITLYVNASIPYAYQTSLPTSVQATNSQASTAAVNSGVPNMVTLTQSVTTLVLPPIVPATTTP